MRALPPAHRQCTLPGLRTSACQKALPACSPQHRLPSKRHAGQNPNAHTMRPSRSRRLSTDPPLSGTVVQLQAALQFSLPGHRRVLKSPGFHNHQTRHCQDAGQQIHRCPLPQPLSDVHSVQTHSHPEIENFFQGAPALNFSSHNTPFSQARKLEGCACSFFPVYQTA